MKRLFFIFMILCLTITMIAAQEREAQVYQASKVPETIPATDALNAPEIINRSLFFEEGFNSWPPPGWTFINVLNNGANWHMGVGPGQPTHEGYGTAVSESYTISQGDFIPNNWMISPAIYIPAGTTPVLSWWDSAQDPDYPDDRYSVYVATTPTPEAFLATTHIARHSVFIPYFINRTASLAAYAGQTIYIAWHHDWADNSFQLKIDYVTIDLALDYDLAAVSLTGPSSINVNSPASYTLTARNAGEMATGANWTARLLSGSTVLNTQNGVNIAPGDTAEITFTWTPTANGPVTLTADIQWELDVNPANDTSPALNITVFQAGYLEVHIGNQDTPSVLVGGPFHFNWHSNISQVIYHQSDIGSTEAAITQVAYDLRTPAPGLEHPERPARIWMANIPADKLIFNNSTDWIPYEYFTLVYEGTVNAHAVGWHEFELIEPFIYTGGNLVIMTNKNDNVWASGAGWPITATTGQRHLYRMQDQSTHYEPSVDYPTGATLASNIVNTRLRLSTGGLGHLSGTVTISGTNTPIHDAHIAIDGTTRFALSNAEGVYNIQYTNIGTHSITVTRAGYDTYTADGIVINEEQNTIHDIAMLSAPVVTLTGTVTSSANSLPLSGASVTLGGFAPFEPVITSPTGSFTIENVFANQTYTLTIAAAGHINYVNENIAVGSSNMTLDPVMLWELTFPAREVHAAVAAGGSAANISWSAPNVPTGSFMGTYDIYRSTEDSIDNPSSWTPVTTGVSELSYIDFSWAGASDGMNRYIVVAVFGNNNPATAAFSNIIIKTAEGYVYIGNPLSTATSTVNPVTYWWGNNISQTIYHANEIPLGGTITEITYRFTGVYPNPLANIATTFRMANIPADKTTFESTTDWIPIENFTTVFTGSLPVSTEGTRDITITLTTPFIYDGGNLVIASSRDIRGQTFAQGNVWQVSSAPQRTLRRVSDHEQLNWSDPGTGDLDDHLPNIMLKFDDAGLGSISGVVTITGSDTPIEGVILSLEGTLRSAVTNAAGEYTLGFLTPGTYTLNATRAGYDDYTSTGIVVTADQSTTHNFSMEQGSMVNVTGIVISSMNALPLPGASVSLSGYAPIGPVTTNENGSFTLPGVFADQIYTITISAIGHATFTDEVEIGSVDVTLGTIMIYEPTFPPRSVLAAITADGTAVNIAWQAPQLPAGTFAGTYDVFRSPNNTLDNIDTWVALQTDYTGTTYTDISWATAQPNVYVYIIRAVWANDNFSAPAFSEPLMKLGAGLVYIGDYNSTNYKNNGPINFWWGNNLTQTLYLQSELGEAAAISEITYKFRGHGDIPADRIVEFYMANVPPEKTEFTSNTDWVPFSEFTEVFRGTLPVSATGTRDITIFLETPFLYTGGGLVVASSRERTTPYNTANHWQITETIGENRRLSVQHDTVDLSWAELDEGARTADVPNTIFRMADTAGYAAITGVVSSNGRPVVGVRVAIVGTNRSTLTDSDGRYTLSYLLADSYDLIATRVGYLDASAAGVVLAEGATVTVDFTMTQMPNVNVTGTVLLSDTEAGAVGIIVSLTGYENYQVETIADGSFTIPEVYSGYIYTISARYAGYETYFTDIIVDDFDLDLPPITLNITEYLLQEGFEGTAGYALPIGWTKEGGQGEYGWRTTSTLTEEMELNNEEASPYEGTRMLARHWESASPNNWAFSASFPIHNLAPILVSFYFIAPGWNESDEYDNFEVRIGTNPTPSGMISAPIIYSHVGINVPNPTSISTWTHATATFTPTVTGNYHLAFRDLTLPGTGFFIIIDDVKVTQTVSDGDITIPIATALRANYPNPFNPSTTIAFDNARNGHVSIEVFNIRGQRVRVLLDEHVEAGKHTVEWNGRDDSGRAVSSGIYFYQMRVADFTQTKRMLLLK